MANAFQNIAEQINFFGAQVMLQLRQELALVDKVNRDYRGAATAKGSTVTIPRIDMSGNAQTRVTDGGITINSGASVNAQVTMQQIVYAWDWDNLQQTFSNVDLFFETAQRAAIKMADGVDGMITGLWPLIPYSVGPTDGSASFSTARSVNDYAYAKKVLKDNRAPVRDLFSILGTTEEFNLTTLPLYQQAQQSGDPSQLRNGTLKPIYNIQPYASQAVPTNVSFTTIGDWGSPTVNGTPAIGSTTITIAAAGNSKVLTKGSIITIAGDTMLNGAPQPYSLTADVTTTSGGAATISISPALKSQPTSGAVITPVTFTGTRSINLVADPKAYLLVIRPQDDIIPGAGVYTTQFTDPASGLTFRLHLEANVAGNPTAGNAYHTRATLDMLAGVNIIRPELAVRHHGAS